MPRKKPAPVPFEAYKLGVTLSKTEQEHLEEFCRLTERTVDDAVRDAIRRLRAPGLISFEKRLELKHSEHSPKEIAPDTAEINSNADESAPKSSGVVPQNAQGFRT